MRPTYVGFEAKQKSGFTQMPPPGAYLAKIIGVKTEPSYDQSREVIVLALEITDGEYAGQYTKVYDEQKASFGDGVKYRGTFRLTPFKEGDEAWVRSRFEGNLWAIQESNPGYAWDWDETRLRGLKVGINVRKCIYTGRDGTEKETTEIGQLERICDVQDGKCRTLKERVQKKASSAVMDQPKLTDVSQEVEVPF